MRLILLVLLLSTSLFAQDAAQQASQAAAQQAQMAIQQAQQDAANAQRQSDVAMQAHQQAMQNATRASSRSAYSLVTEKPRFSPKPGTFTGTTPRVIITDASKGAVIYFTTDGSNPTVKSQRYTGPIALSATTTLKAIAVARFSLHSGTAKGKYVIQ
ncbi:MAG TPA: chitobiase/beta-hexosaminidase C-terminal domain-containing protein [Terriglobales bacterium]|jgi:type II secretory pathway pseudopilin PulG